MLKAFLANSFADEEGPMAQEGKTVYLQGSKRELLALCDFFKAIGQYLKQEDTCHLHFRDYLEIWDKSMYIDVVVGLVNNNIADKSHLQG